MITDDEVMRVLEQANPASVDDPIAMLDLASYRDLLHARGTTVTLTDSGETPIPPTSGRRWPIIVVAAAAVVVIVVSVLVLVARDDANQPQVPAGPSPATGDLIVSVWSHPLAGGGNVHVKVYADGRFLRTRPHWSWTNSATGERYPDVTGWEEQRLTPEGVALLRSEISASGLFEPDQPVPDAGDYPNPTSVPPTLRGIIQVLGDTPVEVHCCWGPNLDRLTEFGRLLSRLREPESWLPASAWADLESTPYVASWYEVCLSHEDLAAQPIEPSQVISVLPAPAQDPLNDAPTRTEVTLRAKYTDATVQTRSIVHCLDLDADNAHTVTAALDAAGSEKDEDQFFYRFETDAVVGTVDISFEPYLPHGEADCGCAG